jgi:predicted nuclease with RNAse H fold
LHGQAYGFKDSVDIVAQTPSGRVALVECTIGLPSYKDKLKKLTRRKVELRRALDAQGFNYIEILPIVVTPLSRADVTADLEEARRLGIAVGCLEDIRVALGQASLLPDSERLYDQVRDGLNAGGSPAN